MFHGWSRSLKLGFQVWDGFVRVEGNAIGQRKGGTRCRQGLEACFDQGLIADVWAVGQREQFLPVGWEWAPTPAAELGEEPGAFRTIGNVGPIGMELVESQQFRAGIPQAGFELPCQGNGRTGSEPLGLA